MHRFFVDPNAIEAGKVRFSSGQAHQIADVLRMRPGERVSVLDDSGWEYEVELTAVSRTAVEGAVRRKVLAATEPKVKIVLYQSVLKGYRFEFALQKSTELGVVGFVPVVSDRCVVASLSEVEGKLPRWQRIIQEAAEQSHRAKLPQIQPAMLFEQACSTARGLSLIPWEEEKERSLRALLRSLPSRPFGVNLFVGPEGGFSSSEILVARHYDIQSITLGPRVLRAETAGLVAAATILYEWGDLGGEESAPSSSGRGRG